MKKFALLVLLLLLPSFAFAQTIGSANVTATGSFTLQAGQVLTMKAQIVGCSSGQVPVYQGNPISSTPNQTASSPFTANGSEVVSFTVPGNDQILCGGQNYTLYAITWLINGFPAAPTKTYRFVDGTTTNLNTATAIGFVPPIINNAVGSQCPAGHVLNGYNADFSPVCQAISSAQTVVSTDSTSPQSIQSSLTAPTFNGTLNGNVNGHASNDLPLSGGTLSGNLFIHGITSVGSLHKPEDSYSRVSQFLSWAPIRQNLITTVASSWKSVYAGIGYSILWDEGSAQYAMVYAGYNGTTTQFGVAYSPDLLYWTDYGSNPIFGPNPTTGQPDSGGVTFPQITYYDGTYYMFYIGFPNSGYEGGQPNIMLATASSLTGTWTRQGVMLYADQLPWGPKDSTAVIYRPSVMQYGDTWYMFFNGGIYGQESVGFATAPALTGPWTFNSTVSLSNTVIGGGALSDPQIVKIGRVFFLFGWYTTDNTLWVASTTENNFPNGWHLIASRQTTSVRPFILQTQHGIFYFSQNAGYTGISLYAPNEALSATGRLAVLEKTPAATDSTLWLGDDIAMATGAGRTRLQLGNTSGVSEFLLGQDSTHGLVEQWSYDANATNAHALIQTFGNSNPLDITASSLYLNAVTIDPSGNIAATTLGTTGVIGATTSSTSGQAGLLAALAPNLANGNSVSIELGSAFGSGTSGFIEWVAGSPGYLKFDTWGGANPLVFAGSNFAVDINGIITAGGGSATTLVCWKSDGRTLGHATMTSGNISACN